MLDTYKMSIYNYKFLNTLLQISPRSSNHTQPHTLTQLHAHAPSHRMCVCSRFVGTPFALYDLVIHKPVKKYPMNPHMHTTHAVGPCLPHPVLTAHWLDADSAQHLTGRLFCLALAEVVMLVRQLLAGSDQVLTAALSTP